MRVAIVGSRESRGLTAEQMICHIPQNCSRIVSGGARGVDAIARQAAEMLGIPITEFRPDYPSYGRKAPLVRNREIVGHADLVLVFWDMSSRGSAHTIVECIQRRVPVKVINLKQLKK